MSKKPIILPIRRFFGIFAENKHTMDIKTLINDAFKTLISSIFAGICISIGCIVNLMSGGGLAGAVLFTFGLIAVVHYKYKLYTGTAGFVNNIYELTTLFIIILLGNVIGCKLMAICSAYAIKNLNEYAYNISLTRMDVNWLQALIRAMLCGFLMTTAVKFARENKWLPLLFAVPVFILAGFYHSIADSFYLFCADTYKDIDVGKCNYITIIIGNFIGCNIYRITEKTTQKRQKIDD